MRTFFKVLGKLIGLLVVALLLVVAYLHVRGLPPVVQQFLLGQLARVGVAAQFGMIRFDLFRGVVATEAVLADVRQPDRPLVRIDEVQLHINWERLIRRQNAIDALRIANANIAVPLPADEEGHQEYFTAQNAFASLNLAEDGTIEVDRLTGLYLGVRLYVSGHVKPGTAPLRPAGEAGPGKAQPFTFVSRIVRELNGIHAPSPPQLDIEFQIDLANPLAGAAVARLRGTDIEYHGIKVDSTKIEVGLDHGRLEIRQFLVGLYGGEVRLAGHYDTDQGAFDLSFQSTTDPVALAVVLPPEAAREVRKVHSRRNPKLTAHYVLAPETGTQPVLTASIDAGPVEYQGVEFRAIRATIENVGPLIIARDLYVAMREGELRGRAQYHIESSDFRYEVDSTLDPKRLEPLLLAGMKRLVEPSWFAQSPHIVARVQGDFVDPDNFAYDATVTASHCTYRGVELQGAAGRLRLRRNQLQVDEMVLTRADGKVTGTVFADFNENLVRFDVATTANPVPMAPLLGPRAPQVIKPYRFGPRTEAQARGQVDFDDPAATLWTAQISNDDFGYWKFQFPTAHGELTVSNDTVSVRNFEGGFYEGRARGEVDVTNLTQPEPDYHVTFQVQTSNVTRVLSALHGEESHVTGSLSGQADLRGRGTDLGTLTGTGSLEVNDGLLWEGTVFGVFSAVLGKTKATSAKATVSVADQWVSTKDLRIAAGVFTGQSQGRVSFDGKLDFRVEAQFLRDWLGIGWLGRIVGQVLEYKVGGTISNPTYRPVRLPKELMPHSTGKIREPDKDNPDDKPEPDAPPAPAPTP